MAVQISARSDEPAESGAHLGVRRLAEAVAPSPFRLAGRRPNDLRGTPATFGEHEQVHGTQVAVTLPAVDSSATSPPVAATCLTTGHLTPLDRYVAFDHAGDPF